MYAGILMADTLALQPYIMKRTAKAPIWASISAPIVLAFVIPFFGRVPGTATPARGLRLQVPAGAEEQKS